MYRDKTILGLIPARGGSKRLPNKNVLPLGGKPLICWTIEAAKNSKYIDDIILSSDDDKLLNIGMTYGIKAIKRPVELAKDEARSIDVVLYHLNQLNQKPEYIILLQPTSPFRTAKHIDEAIEFLFIKRAHAIISVCEVEHSPLWCNTLPDDLSMAHFLPKDLKGKRSQELPKFYRINGAIYICRTEKIYKENTFFLKENIFAYIMDRNSSVDIDTLEDLLYCETLLKARTNDVVSSLLF